MKTESEAASRAVVPMLVAMAASVLVLMAVTGAERRLYPEGAREPAHWALLAIGVFLSVLVYTFVHRALTRIR